KRPEVAHGDNHGDKPGVLITISAKLDDALRQKFEDLLTWLEEEQPVTLNPVAFTLNAGRAHFRKRCALVVDSVEALRETLSALKDGTCPDNALMGSVEKIKAEDKVVFENVLRNVMADLKSVDPSGYRKHLMAAAGLYIKGLSIDWDLFYDGEPTRRIPLPNYPFAHEFCWIRQERPDRSPERTGSREEPATDPGSFFVPRWKRLDPLEPNRRSKQGFVFYAPSAAAWTDELPLPSFVLNDEIDRVVESLNASEGASLYVFMPEPSDDLEQHQSEGLIKLLRLVQALSANDYDTRKLRLTVVTPRWGHPFGADTIGFVQSLAKEFELWDVVCVDVEAGER
ncbi:MAG: hypothetical protein AAF492_33065, partial [Verrucomicrobiota bacterium]